jgi:hypothetical protein
MKPFFKFNSEIILITISFIFLSFFYLSPGSIYIFEKRTDIVLSDGTDQVPAPYVYHVFFERLKNHPTEFFYGAAYTEKVNTPNGFVIWFSWIDKIVSLLLSLFIPVEQISAAISFIYMTFSGLSMFALGKYLKWNRWISLGLGISWGYNAFTIARAKVHPGFDAMFFLPILFLVFTILKEKTSFKKSVTASLLLLFVAIIPQYFVLITFFLSPFWLYYILFGSKEKIKIIKRSIIVIIPSFLLLLWTLAMPISSSVRNTVKEIYPKTGESETGIHPYMYQFAANPIDYLSGNIGITLRDLNPLKEQINSSIYKSLEENNSNTHEHALGIRWLIILISLCPLYFLIFKRNYFSIFEKKHFYFFYALAFFTFLTSLSPQFFGYDIGPSLWLHKAISQVRVPSRAGIFVHFSLLMISGLFLHKVLEKVQLPKNRLFLISIVFPLLILLELPPNESLPVTPIIESNPALLASNCGLGMYFPYVSSNYDGLSYYYFLQMMRNSNCSILNSISWQKEKDTSLLNNFAKHPMVLKAINENDPKFKNHFIKFIKCMPLEWIFFDKSVSKDWKQKVCKELGWTMANELTCTDHFPGKTQLTKSVQQCL